MARVDVVIPSYGMAESDSYIQEWLVAEGDEVEAGTTLVIVETAKAVVEIEAPVAGRVGTIVVPAEAEVPEGTVLTWIEEPA